MPFKLKLKKSKQYNVVSKNLCVISVELLDNTTVECTLSSQSLGQECLSNVCQRLGLQQPQYFGLRYLSKKKTYWWVDLERPLKKQLDKYAQEGSNLNLGVMYFVSDVQLLHDEITRYHYFLQLKTDIIEGRLQCTQSQAILLASYSLQAEFGDHDPERHTTEYLNNFFTLLPKHMVTGKENQEAVLEKVICAHCNLQGLPPSLAEIYYIMEAQQFEGYGLECFPATNHAGSAVYIGVSLQGVFIRHLNGQPPLYFQWNNIVNLVHHKRCFGIESHLSPKMLQFQMEDSHYAKYVWKMCIQQHKFYTKNEAFISGSIPVHDASVPQGQLAALALENRIARECADYKTDRKGSTNQLQASQESLDELGVYHTEGSYSEHVQIPVPVTQFGNMTMEEAQHQDSSTIFLEQPVQNLNINQHHGPSLPSLVPPSVSQSPLPTLSVSDSSNTDISSSRMLYQQASYTQNEIENETKRALLPSYRQAPDYETAVKQKYGIESSTLDVSTSSSLSQTQSIVTVVADSQMDVARSYNQLAPSQSYAQYKNYIDLSHIEGNGSFGEVINNDSLAASRTYDRVAAPNLLLPPMHTYSTPELTSQGLHDNSAENLPANAHLYYQYKPPPPYPYKQRSSSSTPDLTRNHRNQQQGGNNSPDLVSRRNVSSIQLSRQEGDENIHGCLSTQLDAEAGLPVCIQTCRIAQDNQPQSSAVGIVQVRSNFHDNSSVHSPNLIESIVRSQESIKGNHPSLITSHHISSTQSDSNVHTYQNVDPKLHTSLFQSDAFHGSEPVGSSTLVADRTVPVHPNYISQMLSTSQHINSNSDNISISHNWRLRGATDNQIHSSHVGVFQQTEEQKCDSDSKSFQQDATQTMGPMMVAAMNGLTLSRPDIVVTKGDEKITTRDARIQMLESRLAEGQVFLEFEQIVKKKPMADFTTALYPDNLPRNRFKDVLPYEENRIQLTPTKDNRTGYINASHISVTIGGGQRFYIAAQGPLSCTVYSFWQMIWEHHVSVIVMLTEVQEQGREKCYPYWPQDDKTNNRLQFGDFQITRNFSMALSTYVTCSLTLSHGPSRSHRSVWHIQYTDWPDHSCPQDVHGFINFMGQIDAVRRLAANQQMLGRGRSAPIIIHCSAGVGRSGVVILCDIMLYSLDHNQSIDMPKVLTQLRLQRMLTVQTLAQYKFVYNVLIQYLKSSRLI